MGTRKIDEEITRAVEMAIKDPIREVDIQVPFDPPLRFVGVNEVLGLPLL